MKRTIAVSAAAFAATLLATPPAGATGLNRAWVSGHGTDTAGCGAPTTPCRSLQYAHDHIVAAGGEIDVLDPAGYGALSITKAISVVNDGVGTAGIQASSGNAITIDAGPDDAIYLRGLNIDGLNDSAAYGIKFNAGARLTITNCVVRHFSQTGITISPSSGDVRVLVSDSTSSDNAAYGFLYGPDVGTGGTIGVIDRLTVTNNGAGGAYFVGINSGEFAEFTLANSIVGDNDGNGVWTNGAGVVLNVDSSIIATNSEGVVAQSNSVIHLSRSVIDANADWGISIALGASIHSSGDNHVADNGHGALNGGTLGTDSPM